MLETPQTIDLQFGGRRHFFYVYRYTTDQELNDALHRDKITDSDAYEKGITAYTDYYAKGEECGRMYLLDKSIDTLASQAVNMALSIMARSNPKAMFNAKADSDIRFDKDLSLLVGKITSDLYSQSKHF